jgi:hypothetical protein
MDAVKTAEAVGVNYVGSWPGLAFSLRMPLAPQTLTTVREPQRLSPLHLCQMQSDRALDETGLDGRPC